MKRSSIALCIGIWLLACSGQRNESTKSLGSGSRDAEADAEDMEGDDAEVAPREDAEVEAGDTSDGGSDGDAGADAGNGDADAGAQDAATTADAGPQPTDAQADATPQGDASAELRIRVVGTGQALPNLAIVFSQADGTYISDHVTNAQGTFVSSTAPGQVTIVLPGQFSQTNSEAQVLTVVAPALGDFIDIDVSALQARPPTTLVPYELSAQPAAAGLAEAAAYAGTEGCAQAYKQFVPPTTDAFLLGHNNLCVVESGGAVIVEGVDADGNIAYYAGGTLGAPGTSSAPTLVNLGPWLPLETLPTSMLNIPSIPVRSTSSYLWLRKGSLRVRADVPAPVAGAYAFPVARGIVDSFDVDFWVDGDTIYNDHQLRKNVPAGSPSVTFDYATVLPGVLSDEFDASSLLRPTASWTLQANAESSADVVTPIFSWNWMPNGDSTAMLTWIFVAPAGTLSLTPPAIPTSGRFFGPLVPANAEARFGGVVYYDSDQQSNLRDFLREPLVFGQQSGSRRVDLLRKIPLGGTLRAARYRSPGPI
jgi:hypothetical protein